MLHHAVFMVQSPSSLSLFEPYVMVVAGQLKTYRLIVRTEEPEEACKNIPLPALGESLRVVSMSPVVDGPLLTVHQLAAKLKPRFKTDPPHWRTLLDWTNEGHIPAIRVKNKFLRYDESAVWVALKRAKARGKRHAQQGEERS
jgi:hypothetical protein